MSHYTVLSLFSLIDAIKLLPQRFRVKLIAVCICKLQKSEDIHLMRLFFSFRNYTVWFAFELAPNTRCFPIITVQGIWKICAYLTTSIANFPQLIFHVHKQHTAYSVSKWKQGFAPTTSLGFTEITAPKI